jgi:predicted hydrolase (HD superfamily)
MFVQVVDEVKRKQKQKSLKKGVNGNVLEQIFDLLIKLEQKQNGQGLKFITDVVTNHESKFQSSSDLSQK